MSERPPAWHHLLDLVAEAWWQQLPEAERERLRAEAEAEAEAVRKARRAALRIVGVAKPEPQR